MATRTQSFSGSKAAKVKAWLSSKIKKEPGSLYEKPSHAIDSKTPARVAKHADKLLDFCKNKRLNLKNSPPFLQGILMDTKDHINVLFTKHHVDALKSVEYLGIFVIKFLEHCKKTAKLFKDAGVAMENETSDYRRALNKYTLVFSHMLAEIKALLKDGRIDCDFEIVKQEGREFWDKFFKNRLIVPWGEFLIKFSTVHEVCSPEESLALKKTMDMMENDHVSCFEFDIFTRLFQPWKQLLNNWNVIVIRHPAYKAFITYDEVEAMLEKWRYKPGSYVFRLSCTRLGQWAIGFVTSQNKIVQTIPQSKSLYQALIDGAEQGTYTFPNGSDSNPDLREQIRITPQERIKVTKEQYDIYCEIDSTFELCKICNNSLKSIRIDPCGHLLCQACLSHWMETSGRKSSTKCPFCRKTVVSTERVAIEPFDPLGGDEEDDHEDDLEDVDAVLNAAAQRRQSWSASDRDRLASSSSNPPSSPLPQVTETATGMPPATTAPPLAPRQQAPSQGSPADIDPDALRALTAEMGFDVDSAIKALRISRNNLEVATDILLQY